MWEEAIELDAAIDDPYFAVTSDDYERRINSSNKALGKAKKNRRNIYSFNKDPFRAAPYAEQKVLDSLLRFESRMAEMSHSVCSNCHECSLFVTTTKRRSLCPHCSGKKEGNCSSYSTENNMLPVWIDDDGAKRFDVPQELSNLKIAELLLIQRIAPLVPLVHIRNGTLGIKGHVCSFMQDVNEVATKLPRLPAEVKAVRMIRTFVGTEGTEHTKTYMVNRERVMKALHWLVRYHCDYKRAYESGELVIDESNLDWMNGALESELPSVATLQRTFDSAAEADGVGGSPNDGVSLAQSVNPDNTPTDEFESSGVTCPGEPKLCNEAHDALINSLKEAAQDNPEVSVLDWPQTSSEALSEFRDDVNIFTNAFPHLFPGGIADANERNRSTDVSITDWAKHLLYYDDGRFARDPLWCFFTYNFAQRRQNVHSGSYFVKSHISNPPRSLEQLQTQLKSGDSSFVNKIMFYTKRVRGSTAFWRYKKAELYTWINHHVAAGHGPPHIFMTLSCAEYFWPDMIRLLEERIWISEGRTLSPTGTRLYRDGRKIDLTTNATARNKAVNDYSIVVQEFFIKRTEDFLNTVGKDVLGIEYYWCRFEFAKGRGQIHAHLLAILKKDVIGKLQQQLNAKDNTPEQEAAFVADWAKETFGMSAEMSQSSETHG